MLASDEHHVLKADLAAAMEALGITADREQRAGERGSVTRIVTLALPRATPVRARFVRESFIRRAEKLFVDEVEVGSAWFDDLIFVITSTREETARLLSRKRVQQALILLVDEERQVQIEDRAVKLVDADARDEGKDALAELIAIANHVLAESAGEEPGAEGVTS